jgi:hypothetical protein
MSSNRLVHFLNAHSVLRFTDHALQTLNRMRVCSDGILDDFKLYELDSIPSFRPSVALSSAGIVIRPFEVTVTKVISEHQRVDHLDGSLNLREGVDTTRQRAGPRGPEISING